MASIVNDSYIELPREISRKNVGVALPYTACLGTRHKAPTIMFVAAESKDSILQSVRNRVTKWREGFSKRRPLPDFSKAYMEGGEYAAQLALAMAEESHAIQESCDGSRGHARFLFYMNIRKSELHGRIQKENFDIFHFSGHCNLKYGLSLYPEASVSITRAEDSHLTEAEFVEAFRSLNRKIDIAVIASCRSENFARALFENGLAMVAIGTKNAVKDPSIVTFVNAFYKRLLGLEYVADKQSLAQAAQSAFAATSEFVPKKDCEVCIFPEPLATSHVKISTYQSLQQYPSSISVGVHSNNNEYQ